MRHLNLSLKNRSKDALLTLTNEEIDAVQKGMALFAKGLNKARLRKEFAIEPIGSQDNVALAHLIISVLEEHGCNKPGFAWQDEELKTMYEAYQQKGYAYFVHEERGQSRWRRRDHSTARWKTRRLRTAENVCLAKRPGASD